MAHIIVWYIAKLQWSSFSNKEYPFMVFYYEIKLSKRLTPQYNYLKLNTPYSSSTRTNTKSYKRGYAPA